MPDPKDPAPDPQPDKDKADPPAKPPKSPPQPDPTKPTEEELVEAKVQERLKAERLKDEAKALKDKAKAEEEEAKKRGEFEQLHAAEKAARETAEKEKAIAILSEQVSDALADVAADHDGYSVKVLKTYVKPLVLSALAAADAPDAAAIAKATKAAVDQYVKDNPRQQPKGGAAPYQPPHGQRLPKEEKPNGKARSEVALRYF